MLAHARSVQLEADASEYDPKLALAVVDTGASASPAATGLFKKSRRGESLPEPVVLQTGVEAFYDVIARLD